MRRFIATRAASLSVRFAALACRFLPSRKETMHGCATPIIAALCFFLYGAPGHALTISVELRAQAADGAPGIDSQYSNPTVPATGSASGSLSAAAPTVGPVSTATIDYTISMDELSFSFDHVRNGVLGVLGESRAWTHALLYFSVDVPTTYSFEASYTVTDGSDFDVSLFDVFAVTILYSYTAPLDAAGSFTTVGNGTGSTTGTLLPGTIYEFSLEAGTDLWGAADSGATGHGSAILTLVPEPTTSLLWTLGALPLVVRIGRCSRRAGRG